MSSAVEFVIDRLKDLDRIELLQVRNEISRIFSTIAPRGILARFVVPAVLDKPEVVYDLQRVRCGRKRCRLCADGICHGPYWYSRQRPRPQGEEAPVPGRRRKHYYVGKQLSEEVLKTGHFIQPLSSRPIEIEDPIDPLPPKKRVGRRVFQKDA